MIITVHDTFAMLGKTQVPCIDCGGHVIVKGAYRQASVLFMMDNVKSCQKYHTHAKL